MVIQLFDNEKPDYLIDPTSKTIYKYDANGNITGVQAGEDTVEYIYNAANKLTMHQANQNTHQDKTKKKATTVRGMEMEMEMIKPKIMEIATKMKRKIH